MVSIATENFIKTIYNFEQFTGRDTRTGSIARELGITHAAATDMARKLARKKLIRYEKYKDLSLTPAGNRLALGIIRKHRLWETFLHKVFGLSMHEIHREAELLEHQTSDFLAERISQYLGHPSTDPHGDPIPNQDGEVIPDKACEILSRAKPGHIYDICRLSGGDKEYFEFCHSNHLTVGSALKVVKQYQKNRMTEIEINNIKLLLNTEIANTIYIKLNE